MLARATGEMANAHPTPPALNVNIFDVARNGLEYVLTRRQILNDKEIEQ